MGRKAKQPDSGVVEHEDDVSVFIDDEGDAIESGANDGANQGDGDDDDDGDDAASRPAGGAGAVRRQLSSLQRRAPKRSKNAEMRALKDELKAQWEEEKRERAQLKDLMKGLINEIKHTREDMVHNTERLGEALLLAANEERLEEFRASRDSSQHESINQNRGFLSAASAISSSASSASPQPSALRRAEAGHRS